MMFPGPTAPAGNRAFLLAALAATIAWHVVACSPLETLNELSEASHYTRQAGIAYGPEARQVLDLYEPVEPKADTAVIVFFYGGGWREGSKEDYTFVASALTGKGMTVVIPDYRLYPEVRFPGFVEDGARAAAWVANYMDERGSSAPLFLMGHSAGAHLAAMLALDERYLAQAGIDRDRIAGWIGLSGPYDFLPIESGYLLDVFPEDARAASQPINFVSASAPPTLLVHGKDDKTVSPDNSRSLAAALAETGVDVILVEQDGRGHAAVVAALAPLLQAVADTRDVTVRFVRRVAGDE